MFFPKYIFSQKESTHKVPSFCICTKFLYLHKVECQKPPGTKPDGLFIKELTAG